MEILAICEPLRLLRYVTVIFIILCVAFCSPSFSADNTMDISEYVLGPGDVIKISVWQHTQFDTTATVGLDGSITMNLVGDMLISGLTREEVKEKIAQKLSKFIKEGADITVSIVEARSQKISVFGAVRSPKTVTFYSPPSLLDLIMAQCIPAPNADLSNVKIIPGDMSKQRPVIVDITEVIRQGDMSVLPELESGDIIYVPAYGTGVQESYMPEAGYTPRTQMETEVQPELRAEGYRPITPPAADTGGSFVIHIMGVVRAPQTYAFNREPTLIEALLRAGSVNDVSELKYVRIIRGIDPNYPWPVMSELMSGDKVIYVDLAKYLDDGDTSAMPELYSGDIIYVPELTIENRKDVSVIITGAVISPGIYRANGPMNILDAISAAGGLSQNADPENIRIRRESADLYHEKVVNIDKFLSTVGSADPPEMVGPGYRIYVPVKRTGAYGAIGFTRGIVAFLASLVLIVNFSRNLLD